MSPPTDPPERSHAFLAGGGEIRREAGESIPASESQLRALVSAASDVVYRMNADWTEMRHLRGQEFIADTHEPSRSWLDKYIPANDQPQVIEAINAAIRSKSVFELEHRVMRIDGTLGWTFSRAIPLIDKDGEITEWFGMASDVTSRKRAEEALRGSEARIRAFADAAPAMLWETDPSGYCTFLSREWYSFTGQTETEALGLGWTQATHPDDQAEASRVFLAANTRRDDFRLEYRLRGRDGRYRWALDVGRPRFAASGEYLGMVGVVIDIDDRRHAEESLRESEERFRTLFDTMDEGFCVIEMQFDTANRATDYRIVEMNPAFERHTGQQGLVGKSVRASLPDLEEFWYETYGKVAQTGESIRFVNEAKPMGGRWFDVYAFRLGDANGRKVAVLFNDITARKQAEQERELRVGQLREQDQRKDEFLATLAHELRNPLAPLRNGLQVMKLAKNNVEAIEQSRSMMERQLGQMIRLIDDLLDVSRFSRGRIELKRERVDLTKIIQQAIENSRHSIEQANHELVVSVPSDPIYVDADVTRLAQVYANLLNNAAKYTELGGRLRLTIERQGSDAVVTVRDNGVGIAAHMLPQVFELFTQADRSLEKSQGGLGIGLSLVKGLVEMHGGSVEARSEGPGMGSEFIVRVPMVLSLVGEPRSNEGAEAIESSDRRRILVVDDNRDSAISLAMMLKYMGNELRTAHDGLEALDVAAAFRPDVILLDIGMPRLNGYDTARRIREQPWGKTTLLVALTGWGQEEDRQKSQAAGFDTHMVKPVDLPTLEKLLANGQSNSA